MDLPAIDDTFIEFLFHRFWRVAFAAIQAAAADAQDDHRQERDHDYAGLHAVIINITGRTSIRPEINFS
jgi:hypothetical protein